MKAILAIVLCLSAVTVYGQAQSAGTFNPAGIQSLQTTPSGPSKTATEPQGLVIARNRITALEKQVADLQKENGNLRRQNAALVAATQPTTQPGTIVLKK